MILETREYFLGLHDCILSGFGAYVPKIGSVGVGERGLLVGGGYLQASSGCVFHGESGALYLKMLLS